MEGIKKWLVKDKQGHVEGPYKTEEILKKIREKVFQGNEFISLYPDRKWIPMTQEESFYDLLLSLLVQEEEGIKAKSEEEIKALKEKGEEKKEFKPKEEQKREEEQEEKKEKKYEKGKEAKDKEEQTITELEAKTDQKTKTNAKTEVIRSNLLFKKQDDDDESDSFTQVQLTKRKGKQQSEEIKKRPLSLEVKPPKKERLPRKERKKSLPFFILLFMFITIGSVFFFDFDLVFNLKKLFIKSRSDFISLKNPRRRLKPLSSIQVKQKIAKGLYHFRKDTVEDYLKAKEEWIRIIEGDSDNKRAFGLLCMSYFKLWPFTRENAKELRVVEKIFIRTSHVNPISLQSSVCESVYLWLNDQREETKDAFERALDIPFAAKPSPLEKRFLAFLYYIKALNLYEKNSLNASYDKLSLAKNLWPKPLLFYALEGKLLEHFGSYKEASQIYKKILKRNPHHKESFIYLGFIQAVNLNKTQRGENLFHRVLKMKGRISDNALAKMSLGRAEILSRKGGDFPKAFKLAKKAYSLGLKSSQALLLKIKGGKPKDFSNLIKDKFLIKEGNLWFQKGRYHEAQVLYEKAYKKRGPHQGKAAYKASLSLWNMKLKSEAVRWFHRAQRRDPYRTETYLYLSKYYSENYEFAIAESLLAQGFSFMSKNHALFRGSAWLEKKREDFQTALDYAKRALELYEMDSKTFYLISEILLELDKPREALIYATKGIRTNKKDPLVHMTYAKALSTLDNPSAGVHYLEGLLKENPEEVRYFLTLGEIMFLAGHQREAKEYLFKAIKINPQYKEAYMKLGHIFKRSREWQNALDAFYRALSFDISHANSIYEIAQVYKEQKKIRKAKEYFKRTLKMNPKYPLANYALGELSLKQRRYTAALDYAKEEEKINQNLPSTHLLAAKSYKALKQYNLCFDEYQKVLEKGIKSSMIYVNMAECSRLSGGLDASISLLSYALSLESGNALIYRELGIIYETKGEWSRALKAYEKYFALNPQAKDRSFIERRIKRKTNIK